MDHHGQTRDSEKISPDDAKVASDILLDMLRISDLLASRAAQMRKLLSKE